MHGCNVGIIHIFYVCMTLQLVTADKGTQDPWHIGKYGNVHKSMYGLDVCKGLDENLMILFKFHTQTESSWVEIIVRLYRAFMPCLNLIGRVLIINQPFLRIQVRSM